MSIERDKLYIPDEWQPGDLVTFNTLTQILQDYSKGIGGPDVILKIEETYDGIQLESADVELITGDYLSVKGKLLNGEFTNVVLYFPQTSEADGVVTAQQYYNMPNASVYYSDGEDEYLLFDVMGVFNILWYPDGTITNDLESEDEDDDDSPSVV